MRGEDKSQKRSALSASTLVVMTMAGQLVVELPVVKGEHVLELKKRIFRAEGTPISCQKIIQGMCLLQDTDEVRPADPVLLVRMHRKLAVVVFTNSIICVWDVLGGEGLQRFRGHSHLFGPEDVEDFRANWQKSMVLVLLHGDSRFQEAMSLEIWSLESRDLLFTHTCPDSSLGRALSLDVEWDIEAGIRATTSHGLLQPVVFQHWVFDSSATKVQSIASQLHFEKDFGRGAGPIPIISACVAKP